MNGAVAARAFRAELAVRRTARALPADNRDWDQVPEADRADLEAAVQAAVDATVALVANVPDGGAVVVAFRGRLTGEEEAEIEDRWSAYGPETLSLVILDDVEAAAVTARDGAAPEAHGPGHDCYDCTAARGDVS